MSDLRNLLNENYDHIRPILVQAVNNAIQAMEQNDEEGVEKLISQGTQKIKFDSRANAPSPMAEEALQNFSTSNIDSGVEDFDYWELNTI